MNFLLDTSVVSELRKVGSARVDRNVAGWAESVPADALFLSVITIQEMEIGVLRLERRDQRRGGMLRVWYENYVLPAFSGRILDVDIAVARRSATLHVPDVRPVRDTLIAATAFVHGMTLVTRNIGDFRTAGVPVFNPWDRQG